MSTAAGEGAAAEICEFTCFFSRAAASFACFLIRFLAASRRAVDEGNASAAFAACVVWTGTGSSADAAGVSLRGEGRDRGGGGGRGGAAVVASAGAVGSSCAKDEAVDFAASEVEGADVASASAGAVTASSVPTSAALCLFSTFSGVRGSAPSTAARTEGAETVAELMASGAASSAAAALADLAFCRRFRRCIRLSCLCAIRVDRSSARTLVGRRTAGCATGDSSAEADCGAASTAGDMCASFELSIALDTAAAFSAADVNGRQAASSVAAAIFSAFSGGCTVADGTVEGRTNSASAGTSPRSGARPLSPRHGERGSTTLAQGQASLRLSLLLLLMLV